MAKKTKKSKKNKKELTPEERLEQALVPEEEWPYELPEGWKWVRLGDINFYKNKSVTPSKSPTEYFELYSVPSYADDYPEVLLGGDIKSNKYAVEKDDILLCKINPRINRVWKVEKYTDRKLLASSEWIIVRNPLMNPTFLMYWFRTPYFRRKMMSNVSGVGGSLMRARPKLVQNYLLPVTSKDNQRRVAEFIDCEFERLDEAKARIQSVLDSSDERKQSILHKAFTGELTEKWRRENGVSLESWRTKRLGDICNINPKKNRYFRS